MGLGARDVEKERKKSELTSRVEPSKQNHLLLPDSVRGSIELIPSTAAWIWFMNARSRSRLASESTQTTKKNDQPSSSFQSRRVERREVKVTLLRFLSLNLLERLLDLDSSLPLEIADSVVAPDWDRNPNDRRRESQRGRREERNDAPRTRGRTMHLEKDEVELCICAALKHQFGQ